MMASMMKTVSVKLMQDPIMLTRTMFTNALASKYSTMHGKDITAVCSLMDRLELVKVTLWLVMAKIKVSCQWLVTQFSRESGKTRTQI